MTELYLGYLDERDVYQDIYENFALKYILEIKPLTPEALKGFIGKQQTAVTNLTQHKANLIAQNAGPETIAAADAKIQAAGVALQKLQQKAAAGVGAPIPGVVPMDPAAVSGAPPATTI